MLSIHRLQIVVLVILLGCVSPVLSNDNDIRLLKNNSWVYDGRVIVLFGVAVPIATAKCLADEKKWPCGATATLRLNQLLKMTPLDCDFELALKDVALASCTHGNVDLATQLLSEGWAITIGDKADYLQAETRAKHLNLGIWRGDFSPPTDWRQYPKTALDPYLDLACSVCADRKQKNAVVSE